MIKIKKQGWYWENIGSFQRFKKALIILLPFAFLFLTIVAYIQFRILSHNIIVTASTTSDYIFSKEVFLVYSQLLNDYTKIEFIIFISHLFFFLIWAIFGYFSYLSLMFLGSALYQVFFPDSNYYNSLKITYNRYFSKNFFKKLIGPYIVIMIIANLVFIGNNIWEKSPTELIDFTIISLFCTIPMGYFFVWKNFLEVRNTRKTKKAQNNFSFFLFSKKSISEKFKNILVVIFIFSFIGWVAVPFLFGISQNLGNIGAYYLNNQMDYKSNYYLIEKYGYSENILQEDSNIIKLPTPFELGNTLSLLNRKFENIDLKTLFNKFQHGMFNVMILVIICEVAIPSILNLLFFRKERKGFITILYLSLQSIFVILFLQIFIKKAFFIDISKVVGMGPLVLFVITFVLMINSVQPKKE